MPPERYIDGETVCLKIGEAKVIETFAEDDRPMLYLEIGDGVRFTVPLDDTVRITRVLPAEGEPKPGEIWKDRIGIRYFCYVGATGAPVLVNSVGGPPEYASKVNAERGPLERVWTPPVEPDDDTEDLGL